MLLLGTIGLAKGIGWDRFELCFCIMLFILPTQYNLAVSSKFGCGFGTFDLTCLGIGVCLEQFYENQIYGNMTQLGKQFVTRTVYYKMLEKPVMSTNKLC